jgi:1,4-alpha-glucan branching enzyme
MGANLVDGGATFRVWAPEALEVYACGDFNQKVRDGSSLLTRDAEGYWAGFLPGVKDGHRYKFWVKGKGSEGWKRDPYARELAIPWPSDCIVRWPAFPWHETGYVAPPYENFVIYQLHVGTFYSPRWPTKAGTFLDVIDKIPHFVELGVNALQLLPIAEFQTAFSKGYNGTDYFSPEMDFAVDSPDLPPYLARVNALLAAKGLTPYQLSDLRESSDQLRALVDLCHVYGMAVIFDAVYNHAGGDFGEESLYFFDRRKDQNAPNVDVNESQYFIDRGHAGGLVFAFWKREVRQFLIDNARFLLEEYRIDGLRYDQVSVMTQDGGESAWPFCQDLSSTVRFVNPSSLQNAEFWPVNPDVVKPASENGAGFDTTLTDGLRIAIRRVIDQASYPGDYPLDMSGLVANLWPGAFGNQWSFVQGPENHDLVYREREARIPRLADKSDARSWYARSRSRAAFGLAFTAPGIPMLFMGQEFLEDKQWADDLKWHANLRLYWDGLNSDAAMQGFLRFAREIIRLRLREPALRATGFGTIHAHDSNRVLAFHRWVPFEGRDIVVVVSLANFNQFGYRIGFPWPGRWGEVFNSDAYDFGPATGNAGSVYADDVPMHGFGYSASLTLPANSVLVFRR